MDNAQYVTSVTKVKKTKHVVDTTKSVEKSSEILVQGQAASCVCLSTGESREALLWNFIAGGRRQEAGGLLQTSCHCACFPHGLWPES